MLRLLLVLLLVSCGSRDKSDEESVKETKAVTGYGKESSWSPERYEFVHSSCMESTVEVFPDVPPTEFCDCFRSLVTSECTYQEYRAILANRQVGRYVETCLEHVKPTVE